MGTFYICATPIGNLEDVTVRLLKTLRKVDIIACEDTRHTIKLLNRYRIKKPLVSYHEFSAPAREKELLTKLTEGKSIALLCDAGMPLISDPGGRLVQEVIAGGHTLSVVPGPSAFVSALVLSGLEAETFIFMGFPPEKAEARRRFLESFLTETRTVILYEAPHRIQKTLKDISEILGSKRRVSVARELTKKYEEVRRGTAAELLEHFTLNPPRGEFCLLIGGYDPKPEEAKAVNEVLKEVRQLIDEGWTKKEALKIKASQYHLAKSLLYKAMIELEAIT